MYYELQSEIELKSSLTLSCSEILRFSGSLFTFHSLSECELYLRYVHIFFLLFFWLYYMCYTILCHSSF